MGFLDNGRQGLRGGAPGFQEGQEIGTAAEFEGP